MGAGALRRYHVKAKNGMTGQVGDTPIVNGEGVTEDPAVVDFAEKTEGFEVEPVSEAEKTEGTVEEPAESEESTEGTTEEAGTEVPEVEESTEDEAEKLTPKKALQAELAALGLPTDGKVEELKARLAEAEAFTAPSGDGEED